MTEVQILAIDLAKRSFQVCATDRAGSCVDAPSLQGDFLTFFGLALHWSCVRPLEVVPIWRTDWRLS